MPAALSKPSKCGNKGTCAVGGGTCVVGGGTCAGGGGTCAGGVGTCVWGQGTCVWGKAHVFGVRRMCLGARHKCGSATNTCWSKLCARASLAYLFWPLGPQSCARCLLQHVVMREYDHAVRVCHIDRPARLQRGESSCVALFRARWLEG